MRNVPKSTDALDRVAGGDAEAFLEVVRAHELSLRSFIASQVYSSADVDDLAQEAFIAAFRSLARFRRGDDFGAWLRGIARHKILEHFRGLRRSQTAVERFRREAAAIIVAEQEQCHADDSHERIAALLRCISLLPKKLATVVRARLDGVKAPALAESLGTTAAAVYQLHYRANQLLRQCLDGQPEFEPETR